MRKTTISVFVLAVMLSASFAHAAGTSNASLNYVWNGTAWIPWLATSDGKPYVYLDFVNVTSNNLTVNYRAGIGGASPQRPLHISATQDANIRLQDTGGANPAAYIEFYNSTSRYGYFGLPGGERVELGLESGKDFVISGGNVGIGVSPPSYPLDVSGAGRFSGNLYLGTSGRYVYDTGSLIGVSSGLLLGGNLDLNSYSIVSGAWLNATNLNVSSNAYFGGNVGIGTTGPDTQLTIVNPASTSGGINFYEGSVAAGNKTAFIGDGAGVNKAGVLVLANAGTTKISLSADTGDNIYFNNGGNVGIGTTSPQNKLNVIGDANITGTIYSGSTAYGQAYRTADYTMAAVNTWYNLGLTGGNNNLVGVSHSTSVNPDRITVSATGVYLISYSVKKWDSAGSSIYARLYKNGATEITGSHGSNSKSTAGTNPVTISVITSLTANDFFVLQVGTDSAGINIKSYDDGNAPDPTTHISAIVTIVRIG